MLTDKQRDVLTGKELDWYDTAKDWDRGLLGTINCLTVSVADTRITSEARRKMLKKHEWAGHKDIGLGICFEVCPSCHRDKESGHHSDCALDALIKEE